jgi:ribosomal protein S18 acetylase RimI-like enzyme
MTIEEFKPEHAAAYEALNRAWLVGHGLIEEADEPQLVDPQRTIIEAGGQIYVAVDDGVVIGTCGIAPHGEGEFEIVKLAVATSARGKGIGGQLVDACVIFARQNGARRITLLSSSLLGAALRLYERAGFRHENLPPTTPYVTADVYLVLDVRSGSDTKLG